MINKIMSLHFGYDQETSFDASSIAFPVVLPFRVHYKAVSKNWLYPYSLKDGYPAVRMYGRGWITESSTIRILTHLFDNDDTLSDTFKIRYQLSCIMKDGQTKTADLKDINMSEKRHGTLNPNLFIIEETFVISKFISDYKNIDQMTIGYKQLDSATYGNESILELVSVHRQVFPS